MPRRENTFRVDYSQFPKLLSHEEIHKFIGKELGLTRENVLQLQPSRRLGCTFVKVNDFQLAEKIVQQHDNKHDFVFDGKTYKIRITMEDGSVEVKLLELPESVTNDQITDFLAEYGEVISIRDLLWDDRFSEFGGVKTGVRVARMIVTKNIPSLVTIQGEETALRYKGQRQTCLHCHEFVHIGIPCVQNKKLLVQKLAADQSYASVTKSKPSEPLQNKQTNPSKPTKGPRTIGLNDIAGQHPSLLGVSEMQTPVPNKKHTMPPPATPATMKPSTSQAVIQLSPISVPNAITSHRRPDGNETDCSQTSQTSNNSRRSRRQPPGKKMRHSGEDTITAEHEHVRISDDECI
ncbi:uncharacterized protein LOC129771781 [Toxorhynchites rutilus septentrionalis]|uniref:uncharacterized protein LOC129770905 n=1 Tax=Toxorhynchites rutilus septentrionalis TaxID=329112 RepID=UPI002479099C|nr:uncharacterized protein LOC129770905 [Toxorhynchites rutilus septentrionalis]XP_055631787.1 uncharacterized protein LOC129771781 [Toxorhynchites rutilus septentrionalis]